jgi:hypothetical protein
LTNRTPSSPGACAWLLQDPAKLLTGRELLVPLGAPDTVEFDDAGQRLVVNSTLRRRASLRHWLARFGPDAPWTERVLDEAVHGSDRDKSDAGRSIVQVGALMLDPPPIDACSTSCGPRPMRISGTQPRKALTGQQ